MLHSDLPSIGQIKSKYGYQFTKAYIEGWIVNLREFVNLGKDMSDEQTQETAMMIVDEYYNLNIADINFIFKNAKIGKYGKFYDRLDGQIILSWFEDHFSKRCSEAANESIQEASRHKDDQFERSSTSIKQASKIKNIISQEYKRNFNNIR